MVDALPPPQQECTMTTMDSSALPYYALRPGEEAFFTVDELGEHVAKTRDGAIRLRAPLRSLRPPRACSWRFRATTARCA